MKACTYILLSTVCLAVITGCSGGSDLAKANKARAKPAWVRVVNMTDGDLYASTPKANLMAEDRAGSWRDFVPHPPGKSTLSVGSVDAKSDVPVDLVTETTTTVVALGKPESATTVTIVNEPRETENLDAVAYPVLVNGGKSMPLELSAIKAPEGVELKAVKEGFTILPGEHDLVIDTPAGKATVTAEAEGGVVYTLLVVVQNNKPKALWLRNSKDTRAPQAAGAAPGG